jgi:dipeptidyl-peptidase 4
MPAAEMRDEDERSIEDTFPRQYARTQRLSLGEPRNVTVSPDGRRIVFLRSRGGSDPVNLLWTMDATTGEEQLVANPHALLAADDEHDLPPEERARRERARESATGVVAYATNTSVTVASFALNGRLFVAGLLSAASRELRVVGPVFDPRPQPTDGSSRVAYVCGATLRIAELDGQSWELAGEEGVRWGSADFIAAEEMGRQRGFWWSPDGERIAACRVDDSAVTRWWISDPAHPDQEPQRHPYPAAGTANAAVELHVLALDGGEVPIEWDHDAYPYLVDVSWIGAVRLLVTVQSRDQRTLVVLEADGVTGRSLERWVDVDDAWVEIVPGVPGELDDGRLVVCADRDGVRRLLVDGLPVTDVDLQVRSVTRIGATSIVFLANPVHDPTVMLVYRWTAAGGVEELVGDEGVHTVAVGGPTLVVRSTTLAAPRPSTQVLGGPAITGLGEAPLVEPNVTIHRLGESGIAAAILLPRDADPDQPLPVLLDPYGGPHAQRVIASRTAYASSQWFADQGYAVIVADGRGTPGRGSDWERAVHGDLAGPVLEDQIVALHAAARHLPQLDLGRVAIRGWSFGGYLAALAVLRHPDVFHAAIAGAPVTDWRLYDTHYTERYLGDPVNDPGPYDRCSLLAEAHRLERPLLLIHGLADDNVVAAHTLRLSSALLAAGRPHQVLPLSNVSHMTPQVVVAENLLLLQLRFLADSLGTT